MRAPAAERARPLSRLPEPGRFWIRYAPRDWPGAAGAWTDLATAGLGRPVAPGSAAPTGLPGIGGPEPLDDLLYLPPVPPELTAARDALARERLAAGTPVLIQAIAQVVAGAGDPHPEDLAGAVLVVDPLAALLSRDLAPLERRLPPGAAAVWPLAAGLTDDPALWEAGCSRLAAAGATAVQALALDLEPAERRRLVEQCGEAAFEPLFHGPPPDARTERSFARVAHRHGLAPFLPRPLPAPPAAEAAGTTSFRHAGAANRRLAGQLALAGELWLRLGRPAGPGQALYAAARQTDRTAYDLAALAREGNLAPLAWLDASGRRMVEEGAAGETPALLAELLAEYVAAEG